MATQYTDILKLALPVQGELTGTWGDVINDEITSLVEQAIAGRVVIDTWVTNSHTLTVVEGAASESRSAVLSLTDTGVALSTAGTLICPDANKIYVVQNGTLQTITVKTAAGTGVDLEAGVTKMVLCDAVNVVDPLGYNNGASGLAAETVQAAIDEVEARVQTNEADIATNADNIATLSGDFGGLGTAALEDIVTSETDTTAGRIPTMGYAGLVGNTALSGAAVDMDTVNLTSLYAVDATTTGTLPITPAVGDLVFSLAYDGDDLIQYYYDQSGAPDEYRRKIVAGVPSAWTQAADVARAGVSSTEVTGATVTVSAGALIQNVILTNAGAVTVTLDNDFADADVVVINKQLETTSLTVDTTGGDTLTYPDATTDTQATLNSVKAIIYFVRSGSNFDLNIVG